MKLPVLFSILIVTLLAVACGGGSSGVTPPPIAPAGISAIAGDTQVQLSWSDVPDATSYNVYYRNSSGVTKANGIRISNVTSGGFITGLSNDITYYFAVTAVNTNGESAVSSEVNAKPSSPPGSWTTKTPMMNQRDNATNAVLDGKIYVMGGAPAGLSILDSMEMYDPSTDTWATKASLPAWSTFATVPPWAANGTSPTPPAYRYGPAAAAINGEIYLIGGTSLVTGQGPIYPVAIYDPATDSWSNTVPANAATNKAGSAGQTLKPIPTGRWGFDIAVIDGLLYAVGGGVYVPGNLAKATSTEIAGATSTTPIVDPAGTTITGLTNWNHYYFFVTAVDGSGNESAASYNVSALLRGTYAAGEGSTAGDGQATISWMSVSGATSYNLYYSIKSGVMPLDTTSSLPANVTKLSGISATASATASTTVTGLTNGTPYYFIATAMTASGEVMATNQEISVTPQGTPTATVPANVTVTGGDGQATLSWTPVAGAVSYNIYYGTGTNLYYGNVEVYDPVANTWTMKASMQTPRWGSTVSVIDGLIYAIGGWNGWPELSVVEVYDPATDTWSGKVPRNGLSILAGTANTWITPMPTARDDFGFAVVNGTIYAIGGDTGTFDDANGIPCCTNVVETYNPVMNTWTAKTAMPTIRDDFDASVVDGVIYAIAGSRDGIFSDPTMQSGPYGGGYSLTTVEALNISNIPVPSGVTATAGVNQVTLNWNPTVGATSYNVYWSSKAGVSTKNGIQYNNHTSTTFLQTGLGSGLWYYYVVTAVTAAGESLPSNEVAIKL